MARRVALFATGLIDALFPDAGRATVELLERLGQSVEFPLEQTCCGQMHHYQARTHLVPAGELDDTVRAILDDRGVRRIAVPDGIPDKWVDHLELLRDEPALDAKTLDEADGVITTCTLAIAQSGTIVLDGGPGMGRRILSLVPDYHLCVVRTDQLVGSLPEAIGKLEPTRPLTFISGPSATVDIEMVRVRGVHGPRRLEVVLVTD